MQWRGKPVFIRHRTGDDIEDARKVDVKALRDPQKDEERVQKPEWLIMVSSTICSLQEAHCYCQLGVWYALDF